MLVFLFIAAPMLLLPVLVIPPLAVLFVAPFILMLLISLFGFAGQRKAWCSLVAIATWLAVFVVVSVPLGAKRARHDAALCQDRRPAGQGAIEYCIKQRRDQRWGPWQAWGSNPSAD